MKNISFEKLQEEIAKLRSQIEDTNERISLADNEYELLELATELEFWENQLLVAEEYMDRTISRGRR